LTKNVCTQILLLHTKE